MTTSFSTFHLSFSLRNNKFITSGSLKTHIKTFHAMSQCTKRDKIYACLCIRNHSLKGNATRRLRLTATSYQLYSLLGIAIDGSVADADAIPMLQDGDLAAYVSGTWNTASFEEQYGDNYAACKLPTFDVDGTATQMGSYAGYKFVGVNSHAKNAGWSMLLAEYLTNEESQLAIGQATSEGPANTEAAKQIDSPALAALAAQAEFADQQVVGNQFWDPAKALGQNLVDGASDLQAVLDDAVSGITQPVAE